MIHEYLESGSSNKETPMFPPIHNIFPAHAKLRVDNIYVKAAKLYERKEML
jgi:hypothetical protein